MLSRRIVVGDLAMSQDGCCGCKDCKQIHEHVASLSLIKVLEADSGMFLGISGWLVVMLRLFWWGRNNEWKSLDTEQEKQLKKSVEEHASLSAIAKTLGKSLEAVRSKANRLGLVDDDQKKKIVVHYHLLLLAPTQNFTAFLPNSSARTPQQQT